MQVCPKLAQRQREPPVSKASFAAGHAGSHRGAGAPEGAERLDGLPAQHELVVQRRRRRPDRRPDPEDPLRVRAHTRRPMIVSSGSLSSGEKRFVYVPASE